MATQDFVRSGMFPTISCTYPQRCVYAIIHGNVCETQNLPREYA